MTRYVRLSGIALLLVGLASCGGGEISARDRKIDPQGPEPTPAPCDASQPNVVLSMFAARNCDPCIKELPELKRRLESELNNQGCRVKTTVYMLDDELTQAEADEWGTKLGVPFTMALDPNCRKTYRTFWKHGCIRPAGVVLSESGEEIKKYKPGGVELNDLMSILKGKLVP